MIAAAGSPAGFPRIGDAFPFGTPPRGRGPRRSPGRRRRQAASRRRRSRRPLSPSARPLEKSGTAAGRSNMDGIALFGGQPPTAKLAWMSAGVV